MAFHSLEKLHRLVDGYQQVFRVGGRELLLVQDEGETHLFDNVCPHMDAPLTYASIQNGLIRCPLHGIEFQLHNGAALRSPVGPIKKHRVVYDGDQVGVELN